MKPRGQRLACSLKTLDGCIGSYDVHPGEAPKSIAKVGALTWDRPPQKEVLEAAFSLIGEMGMTGHIIKVNQSQWRALTKVKLHEPFYVSILGKEPVQGSRGCDRAREARSVTGLSCPENCFTSPQSNTAGLPALQFGEPGQVRKEAATAIHCKCRGKARHPT